MASFKWHHGAARFLGLLLLMLGAVVGQAQFGYETNNGAITITRFDISGSAPGATVIIPSAINGLPVTRIGEWAFYGVTNVASITIPNTVTDIELAAFSSCPDLEAITVDPLNPSYTSMDGVLFDKSVSTLVQYPGGKVGAYTIPNSVTHLGTSVYYSLSGDGYGPFEECIGLTSLAIPNGITKIGAWTFFGCTGLTNVTMPNNITRIEGGTFLGCTNLTAVTIPSSVKSIGSEWSDDNSWLGGPLFVGAFEDCTSLTHVTIPNSVTNLALNTFSGCTSLKSLEVAAGNPVYESMDGVLLNKGQSVLIWCPLGKTGSYAIPNSVTNIGGAAFSGCTGLTDVGMPNSITQIEDRTFLGCTGLTSVTIPNSVTKIGAWTFQGCTGLTNVTMPNNIARIEGGTFLGCTNLTAVTIPSSVKSIGSEAPFCVVGFQLGYCSGAFERCTSLKSIAFPNSVTDIGDLAFSGCTGLTNVTIPNSVTSIGDHAFSGCTGLSSVKIPNSLTNIGYMVFSSCTSLTSIVIPNSVTNIGYGAFSGCTGLSGIYFRGNAPLAGDDLFSGTQEVVAFHLPGTTGWEARFGGRPTALWLPRAEAQDDSFGVRADQFGFNIAWASGQVVVVETATELLNPVWSPLQTITLTSDSVRFTDPEGSKEPTRFYRVRPQ